ncbi:1289_t:CDS:1, partial [Funneliformis geosporum]
DDRNEIDVTEPIDNTNIGNEDFSLDNNVDLLFEKVVNALTN